MFTRSKSQALLDMELCSALEKLSDLDKKSEEYGILVDRISKLHKLRTEERPKRISPDTILVVAANLFGILWITRFERENVISTKSLGFIMKPR